MSKAFTSESDDEAWIEPPSLPPGVKNYMTPEGERQMKDELQRLQDESRGLSADVVSASRKAQIERRMHFLEVRLESAIVVEPVKEPADRVRFGNRVTLADAQGQQESWRIVGIDEADLARGSISWTSPLAEALLEKRSGDTITFRSRTLKLLSID